MYWLNWKAPEGRIARAELDGTLVTSNAPVPCRTWWAAALLAAKIAYDNESLTDRVTRAAEEIDSLAYGQRLDVNGWTFWISAGEEDLR
jgi:hypothetical protein